MRILVGTVMTRHGIAAERLAPVQRLIAERMELPPLTRGTLNLRLASPYLVHADAKIEACEYDGLEFLKLQRCRINGIRCCIMRPDKHEESEDASKVLEIMAPHHFRNDLGVQDGDTLDVEVEGDETWWAPRSWGNRIPPPAEPAMGE
jgi:CTP-dependent riboflavin kinase